MMKTCVYDAAVVFAAILLQSSVVAETSESVRSKVGRISLTNAAVAFAAPKTSGMGVLFAEEAAKDLTNALAKVTGRAVPIVPEDCLSLATNSQQPLTVIYVGDTQAAKRDGIDVQTLKDVESVMRAKSGRIFLAARTGMGVNNAVIEFLQRYCDYWFVSAWGDAESYAFDPKLSVPDFDMVLRPAFAQVFVHAGNNYYDSAKDYRKRVKGEPDWFGKRYPFERRCRTFYVNSEADGANRVSARSPSCHSQFDYMPPEKYFKEHPEWYSMDEKGERCAVANRNSQLCYTNKEALEEIWKCLRARVLADRKANPKDPPMIYDFSQMDQCRRLCLCPECKKVTAKGGDSALQLVMVNELARRLQKEFPGTMIRTFAYVSTETVPTDGTMPEPNVMIWICDLYGFSDHERPLGEKPLNDIRKGILDDWFKLTPNVEIWDYMLANPRYFINYPEVNLTAIASDAKYFRDNGVKRYFTQHGFSNPCSELNQFLIGELFFNPDADESVLLEKYCRMFGEGQRQVHGALEGLIKRMKECGGVDGAHWASKQVAFRNWETWEPFLHQLEAAYPLVPHGSPKGTVAWLLVETCRELLPQYKLSVVRTEELKRLKPLVRGWLDVALKTRIRPGKGDRANEEYRGEIEAMLSMLDVDFKDRPACFEKTSPQDVIALEYHSIESRYRDKLVKDAKSTIALVSPCAATNEVVTIPCGTYDFESKANLKRFSFQVKRGDDDYRWHCLGTTPITRLTTLWITNSWNPHFGLGKYWHTCDGRADDNFFEIWVSARRDTPANKLYIDRVLLRRVTE